MKQSSLKRRWISVLLAAVTAFSLSACSQGAAPVPDNSASAPSSQAAQESSAAAQGSSAAAPGAASSFQPGTYTASAKGNNGDVTVEVTFTDTKIESVTIKEHQETEGLADPALEKIPAAITQQQSLAVEAVAGATNTSKAIVAAVEDCVKQAGGDPASLQTAPEQAPKGENEEITTDVAVVGGGAAGTAAALAAVEAGKQVTLIEKTASPMGAATLAGVLFATDSTLQKEAGKTVDPQWVYDQFMETSQYHANGALLANVIAKSGSTVDWLMQHGVKLNLLDPGHGGVIGHLGNPTTAHGYDEGGVKAVTQLHEIITQNGGQVRYETTGKALLTDGGKVTGVKAVKADGGELTIHAKSVVLATGGFAGSEEMTKEIFGDVNYGNPVIKSNTGDGIQMAWEAGAARGIVIPQNYGISGNFSKASDELKATENYAALTEAFRTPVLFVNSQGTRFTNEEVVLEAAHGAETLRSVPGGKIVAVLDQGILNQIAQGGTSALVDRYSIFQGNNQRYIEGGKQVDTDQRYAESLIPKDTAAALAKAVEEGIVIKADTPQELGEKLSMPRLADTVAHYNELCRAGKDTDQYKDPAYLDELATGPYYAVEYGYVNYLGTLGGVQIDENIQAVDDAGAPVENLWVAGADASGAYGNAYVPFEGGTLGFAYNTGRIAGENAAQNAQ